MADAAGLQESHSSGECDLSVVIVSWNARRHLCDCLRSIEETRGDLALETIVVDNASSDGSPEAVKEAFPGVRLIEAGSNLGFARGNNLGIRHSRGRYLFLINSDVVLHAGCLQALLAFMDTHPDVGLAGPRLLNADGSMQVSCRFQPTLANHLGRALFLNTALADPAYRKDIVSDVQVITGAFWVARREAVETVGGLDEAFFFYGEDLDWCLRFQRAGWRLCFFPGAFAVHFGGASSANDAARFSAELQRARLRLWEKYHGRLSSLLYLAIEMLYHVLRLVTLAVRRISAASRRSAHHDRRLVHRASLAWAWKALKSRCACGGATPA